MKTTRTVRLVLTETEAWFLRSLMELNQDRIADDAAAFAENAADFDLETFIGKVEATQRATRPPRFLRAAAAAAGAMLLTGHPAFAGGTGGGGDLPWESTLTTIQNSLSGPVASAVAVIAIVAAGMILAMGGVGTLARIGVSLVLGLSLALGANNVITSLFSTGATF